MHESLEDGKEQTKTDDLRGGMGLVSGHMAFSPTGCSNLSLAELSLVSGVARSWQVILCVKHLMQAPAA